MMKQRVKLLVEVDLGPAISMFHEPQDWADYLSRLLRDVCPHYKPTVKLWVEED
jgi:hypothetical protein